MMQDQAIRALRSVCVASVLCGALVAACAGGDTPARTDELEQLIADTYGRGRQVGAGASGGAGGSSASGTGGSAGSGSMVGGTGGSGGGGCNGFELLQTSCGGNNCHGGPNSGTLTNFAFDEATASALEGQPSAASICTMDSAPVFDSGNAPASLVMKKIDGSASCGQRMPPGGPFLQQADIDCIQTWIESL
jgi:hypothetical protein